MLEGYEVLRKISEGASAEVYLARPRNGSGHVIAEVMRPELLREPALVSCFAAAAKARCAATHPNIAQRVRSGVAPDGRHWLVTEPVGESLASRLASRGALPPEALIPLALQVCDGLEFMHRAGLVHGNLKPATVYVLERAGAPGQVKLIDFGLSFLRPGAGLGRPPGVLLVESEYLAPERVQGQRATVLADLYGAGVLFYELLTGFPPFTGAESSVVRRRQIEEPPALLPESCAQLAPVLERCLAKDPAARFQSAGELRSALREILKGIATESIDVDLSMDPSPGGPAHPPAPLPVLGSYALVRTLGRGAMGQVFLARHLTLGRRVALKLLRPELARSRSEVERFVQEAQAVNKIRHDHIVEIYDCVDETAPSGERRVFLVMELLAGRSLGETLAQGPLPLRRALRVMRQVALALDAVHRVGVVHRDVKPDNIFLTPRAGADFVKVLDFGVAKLREQGLDLANGVPVVVGTPSHMAPEQLLGRLTDHRTDVWALGVVLYRLLSGRLPFDGALEQMVRAIVRDAPPPLPARTQRDEPIPEALRSLVAGCLEKDPERRPQTMAEVGAALEGLLAPEPAAARPAERRPRRFVRPLVAAGLAGALAVAGAALAGRGPDSPPPALEEPRASEPVPAPAPAPAPARDAPAPRLSLAVSGPASGEVDAREALWSPAADASVPAEEEPPARATWEDQRCVPARAPAEAPAPNLRPAPGWRPGAAAGGRRGMNRDDVIDPFHR
ncbi:MAG TPA: serine/threonine-protein kinase [Myxococcales bacterium]|jgi:serine/threonine-protein kinase